jgi:hypothetical protein
MRVSRLTSVLSAEARPGHSGGRTASGVLHLYGDKVSLVVETMWGCDLISEKTSLRGVGVGHVLFKRIFA